MTDTYTGIIQDQGGEVLNVLNPAFGAKGDTVWCSVGNSSGADVQRRPLCGATINAGSTSLTTTSAIFKSTDVGKVIVVQGAGPSGAPLATTVASYVSATAITVTHAASTSVIFLAPADFSLGTDDTAAIVSAISSGGDGGRVLLPPGYYTIRAVSNGGDPITLPSLGGLQGYGGKSTPGATTPSTVLYCGDAEAGVSVTGSGTYQGFMVDGNRVATATIRNTAGSNARFIDVWATRATGPGWTVTGVHGNSYWDCGTMFCHDGLYIDGGSSNLQFLHFFEHDTTRYAIRGGHELTPGLLTHDIVFSGGILDQVTTSTSPGGKSKVYLRGAIDWSFRGLDIVGNSAGASGPAIDLDQSSGYGIEFSDLIILAPQGLSPPVACIQVSGTPGSSYPYTFLRTDGLQFYIGDVSVEIKAAGNYTYTATSWVSDATTNGPVASSGLPGIDTLLSGRTGAWKTANLSSANWVGSFSYRVNADGRVQLKGSIGLGLFGTPGTAIFTLPLGYRPATTQQIPVAVFNGIGYITITSAGVITGHVVSGSAASGYHLDGVVFARD